MVSRIGWRHQWWVYCLQHLNSLAEYNIVARSYKSQTKPSLNPNPLYFCEEFFSFLVDPPETISEHMYNFWESTRSPPHWYQYQLFICCLSIICKICDMQAAKSFLYWIMSFFLQNCRNLSCVPPVSIVSKVGVCGNRSRCLCCTALTTTRQHFTPKISLEASENLTVRC